MNNKYKKYIEDFNNKNICFEMFTEKGNDKVKKIIEQIMTTVFEEDKLNSRNLESYIKKILDKIVKKKQFEEIRDTEPETHIQNYVNEALKFKGENFKVNRWRF